MGRSLRDLKFSRATLVPDAMAGLTVALVSIPEGMAFALVAGVNPVYGLYTGMVTTIVASLTVSTSLMVVTLTNALALVTADQLQALGSGVDPVRAMFTLTLLTGAVMFVLGSPLILTNTATITAPFEMRPADNVAKARLQVSLPPPPGWTAWLPVIMRGTE